MALAYAVILVTGDLFDRHRRDTVQMAQDAADKKFEKLAQENMKGLVTRNPEPHIMSVGELRQHFPHANLHNLVGLRFTADIT